MGSRMGVCVSSRRCRALPHTVVSSSFPPLIRPESCADALEWLSFPCQSIRSISKRCTYRSRLKTYPYLEPVLSRGWRDARIARSLEWRMRQSDLACSGVVVSLDDPVWRLLSAFCVACDGSSEMSMRVSLYVWALQRGRRGYKTDPHAHLFIA